ncbi:hypothetical protein JB92DRAFT_3307315, partial [Gautieria morchelliformis]
PPGEKLLCDNTVAHVVGRMYAASSTKVLDGVSVTTYPGNPSSDDYEDTIPDNNIVVVWALGAVLHNAETDLDTNLQQFNLGVSDYVCGGTKTFIIECILLF